MSNQHDLPNPEFDAQLLPLDTNDGETSELSVEAATAGCTPSVTSEAQDNEAASPKHEEDPLRNSDEPTQSCILSIDRLTDELRKYHDRAAHREKVISSLQSEVELLRRGERRSLLRPLLTTLAEVHEDLLRQADTLPENFDSSKAKRLLQSFADSVEMTLEDHGVKIEKPEVGTQFDARRHRAIGKSAIEEADQANKIAEVRRGGYIDSETGSILSHAQVVVFVHQPAITDPEPQAIYDNSDQ